MRGLEPRNSPRELSSKRKEDIFIVVTRGKCGSRRQHVGIIRRKEGHRR